MRKIIFLLIASLFLLPKSFSQGYKVGDNATDFSLKNIDGKFVSLKDYPAAKGFVVIFTCNHCPFAQAYQNRIIAIDKKYKNLGYPVIAISPNDPLMVPEDSYENMVKRAKEMQYSFPYLIDETQNIYRTFGAKHTPHVYLLEKKNSNLVVQYIGAIDDNYKDETKVTVTYLSNAIDALLAGRLPDPSFTKAIGCSIKDKQFKPE
jgi:peroxiredoxin